MSPSHILLFAVFILLTLFYPWLWVEWLVFYVLLEWLDSPKGLP